MALRPTLADGLPCRGTRRSFLSQQTLGHISGTVKRKRWKKATPLGNRCVPPVPEKPQIAAIVIAGCALQAIQEKRLKFAGLVRMAGHTEC